MFSKFILAAVLAFNTAVAFAAVDANKASQAELESVKGIGPGLSGRIVEARKSGPFADWADLRSRVKGVGESGATKFSAEGLTVNGQAFGAGAGGGGKPVVYQAPKAKADATQAGKAVKGDKAKKTEKADKAPKAKP
jgi:competence protein ComEA